MRDGEITQIPKREIVVGDLLYLETGEEIPADAELLEAVTLSVDEINPHWRADDDQERTP